MKKITLLLCLIYALFSACSEEESPQLQEREKVQFTLGLSLRDTEGGRTQADIPPGSVASVEISGPSGVMSEKLEIISFGDSYLTSPLDLTAGSYQLLSFLIISEEDEVLFAAPKDKSPLAPAVDDPLPMTFYVKKGSVSNVSVQVIKVGEHAAEDFGYASFGINLIRPLAVTAFIIEDGVMRMTEAAGAINFGGGEEPLQQFALAAKVNYISFDGEDDQPYLLTVSKPGYRTSSKPFTYGALGPNPQLSVVLEKMPAVALRYDAQPWDAADPWTHSMIVQLSDTGSLTVDWGDATVQTFQFGPGTLNQRLEHAYHDDVDLASITVSGDLDKIIDFLSANGRYHNLEVLPNLEYFTDFRSDINPIAVDSIDFSGNYKLKMISLEEPTYDMILGENKNELTRFWFRGGVKFNQIVPELEAHVTSTNLREGIIEFFYRTNEPSEENLNTLRRLRDDYDWYIGFDYEAL